MLTVKPTGLDWRPTLRLIPGGGKPWQDARWVNGDPGPEATQARVDREKRAHERRVAEFERRWHTIYKLFDAKDRLLYVGISMNGPGRLPGHSRKDWWLKAARCEFEHVKGRTAAEDREKELIIALEPLWNAMHNPRREREREAARERRAAQ